jgi:flavin-binding protein dodecin
MSDVAKVSEIIVSSKKGFEDAVQKGIARANKTLKGVRGAWIDNMKVVVEKGKIVEYRVNMRVTFVLTN